MDEQGAAPLFVFAPYVSSPMRVEPAWIDYNGHMNMAYYLVLFDRAIDEAFAIAGLGPDYVETRRASYFTAELHTVYRRELSLDKPVRVTVQLLDHDEKRVHAYLEIRHALEGWVSASCEKLFLHVDMSNRRVAPFPADILANLAAMKTAHQRLPRPAGLGRTIGIRPRQDAGPRETDATLRTGTRH